MAVPVWTPGQVLPASDVNSWFTPHSAVKPATTGRTGVTLSLDPDLQVPVAANAVYDVKEVIVYNGPSAAGYLAFSHSAPSGSGFSWTGIFNYQGGGSNTGPTFGGTFGLSAIVTPLWTSGVGMSWTATTQGVLIVGGTAGTFGLTWGQALSNGVTSVQQNSFIVLQRIA